MLQRARNFVQRAAQGVDSFVARAAHFSLYNLLFTVILAITTGTGLWALRNQKLIGTLAVNKLPEPERMRILISVGGAFAAILLFYVGVILIRRIISGHYRPIETVSRTNRWLTLLAGMPIVAALLEPKIEQTSPKLVLFLIVVVATLASVTFYEWPLSRDSEPSRLMRLAARVGAPVAITAIGAGYAIFFSKLAITNHHGLGTRTVDLGYYDNIFYQSIHGNFLGCSLIKGGNHATAHFDPLLVILSPLYLIYPRAEMILVLQSVWLAAGVFPIYLLAKSVLKSRWAGVLLALAYVLYPAMQGANMYEFHSLTLLTPIILWVMYFLETGAMKRYWFMTAVALLCREDVALVMCFIGIYSIITKRPSAVRAGWITIGISVAYFLVAKLAFMPSSALLNSGADSHSYAYYYSEMIPNRNGAGGLIVSLLTNPVFALTHALGEAKILFVLVLFVPLAFLPFVARKSGLLLFYGLFFCLMATRTAVFQTSFQYSSLIIPFAFVLTTLGLDQLEQSNVIAARGLSGTRLRRALLGAVVVSSLLTSWKFGGFIDNDYFRGGFSRVVRTLSPQQEKTYAWLSETIKTIPPTASVSVTNRLGPHVSNRSKAYVYPGRSDFEYALVDEHDLRGKDLEAHRALISSKGLMQLARKDSLALFKRGATPPAAKAAPSPEAQPEPSAAPSAE